uniref:Uncharacterized protein n=1 Tax=Romanomermis culicivorax TaxID=13658 RepID=A0A915L4E2_ROMCU
MAYCRCFLVCFFVTLSYAWPTVKKIAADDDNTRGKILEWSHLIDKRSTEEADADDEGNSLDRSIAETSENSGHQEDNLESPASAAASNDFDWKLLQSSNKRLADEIHRRRRRSSHFSKVAQKRLLRSKRAPPPQFTPPVRGAGLIGDETSPVERWGSEQNIAFDGDEIVAQAPPAALTNNQVQLTENDLKKLANLIETMQHLNEEGYGVDGNVI